jgi:hypothetical protein
VRLAFSPGYASSRRSAIVASSARACSGETPLRRRPATCRNFALRLTSPAWSCGTRTAPKDHTD